MVAFRLRAAVSVAIHQGKIGSKSSRNVCSTPLLSCAPVVMLRFDRSAHFQNITRNIQYISEKKEELKADPSTMKLNKQIHKPLCIIMNWMLAKPNHVLKYAKIYLDLGYDVVSVSLAPLQLMWPLKGSQLVAADLLKFMEVNKGHEPLVVHGFSVGAYLWAELLVRASNNMERYKPVLDRVAAQVWDSPADVYEIPVGMPLAMFPKNKFMQATLRTYTKFHLKLFHNVATQYYFHATDVYHSTPCRAPALYLLSKTDPVGAEKRSRKAHDMWMKMGIKCSWKCWEKSPHVQHYIHHPEEYLAAVHSHLEECGLLHRTDKTRLRV